MAKRQMRIPGTEGERVKEIEAAAEAYVKVRDERMTLTRKETEKHDALLEVMKKHKKTVYRDDEAVPPLMVTYKAGKEKVKVDRAEEPESE